MFQPKASCNSTLVEAECLREHRRRASLNNCWRPAHATFFSHRRHGNLFSILIHCPAVDLLANSSCLLNVTACSLRGRSSVLRNLRMWNSDVSTDIRHKSEQNAFDPSCYMVFARHHHSERNRSSLHKSRCDSFCWAR